MARKRLFGYYKQFGGLSDEEVTRELHGQAAERKAAELQHAPALDCSVTTWPEPPHPRIVNALAATARRGLHRAQSAEEAPLRHALAERHGLPLERLVVGDGAGQLLSAAVAAFTDPGDAILTLAPIYPLYGVAATRASVEIVTCKAAQIDELELMIDSRTKVVLICNPVNPTGELLGTAELARAIGGIDDSVTVVIDEALRDYAIDEPLDDSFVLLDTHPRALIVRTFSKVWGLAALRCGYAIAGERGIAIAQRIAPGSTANALGHAGALEALRLGDERIAERVAAIATQRTRLAAALPAAAPSQINAIWAPDPGGRLAGAFAEAKILVAPGDRFGAPGHLRITVPHRPELTDRLLAAIEGV